MHWNGSVTKSFAKRKPRQTSAWQPSRHLITIPHHDALKTGTLHGILAGVAQMRSITVESLARIALSVVIRHMDGTRANCLNVPPAKALEMIEPPPDRGNSVFGFSPKAAGARSGDYPARRSSSRITRRKVASRASAPGVRSRVVASLMRVNLSAKLRRSRHEP